MILNTLIIVSKENRKKHIIEYKINIRRIVARQTVLAIAQGSIYQAGREVASAKDLRAGMFQG